MENASLEDNKNKTYCFMFHKNKRVVINNNNTYIHELSQVNKLDDER